MCDWEMQAECVCFCFRMRIDTINWKIPLTALNESRREWRHGTGEVEKCSVCHKIELNSET